MHKDTTVIMDVVGKAMFSQQMGKMKDDFGFNEEEEKSKNYDPGKWAEEDAKQADQKWAVPLKPDTMYSS